MNLHDRIKRTKRSMSALRSSLQMGRMLWILAFLLANSPAVEAAIFQVDRVDDEAAASDCSTAGGDCSLRGAVWAANANPGPDEIVLPEGLYNLHADLEAPAGSAGVKSSEDSAEVPRHFLLQGDRGGSDPASRTGEIFILDELTVTGAGRWTTRISGGGSTRILRIGEDATVRIKGLTISGGAASGGSPGGAIRIEADAVLHLVASAVTDSRTEADECAGGAIANMGGELILADSEISGNWTSGRKSPGGGIYNRGKLTISRSRLVSNRSTGPLSPGGFLYNDGGEVFIRGATITDSEVAGDGSVGGAIANNGGKVEVRDSQITRNRSLGERGFGGALYNGGEMFLHRCSLAGNTTQGRLGWGGAVANLFGTLNLENTTLSDNRTLAERAPGAGVYNAGEFSLKNSTVSGNRTLGESSDGGGLYLDRGKTILIHATVLANRTEGTESRGGGVMNSGSFLASGNTIVAGNDSKTAARDCFGKWHSLGGNLIGDISGCDLETEEGTRDKIGDSEHPLDPLSAHLALNAPGITRTHALKSTSPALDLGNPTLCEAEDQRGVPRSGGRTDGGGCDSGAYEYAGLGRGIHAWMIIGGAAALLVIVFLTVFRLRRVRRKAQNN